MSAPPPPLIHPDPGGTPYVRRQELTHEITSLVQTDSSSWSSDKLHSETLVHLIRVLCKRGGEDHVLGQLVFQLGKHIARIVKDVAKGFDPTTTDEIILKVGENVVALVL